MTYETVIGLEVHAQLNTQSKLFSPASTNYGSLPNSQTCFIDAGLPGTLPVLNKEAVKMAVKFGLAIDAQINDHCFFERKNYFYADLPKGYQISQALKPIITNGYLTIVNDLGESKSIHIVQAHLEEDAGKLLHDIHSHSSGIDLNRAGIPLLEIITAPCITSAREAIHYLKTLHQLLRFLGICDGNMQEGSFRCDVNVSIRPQGHQELGTRIEIKNLNSFKFIEKAISYEEQRQRQCLESGQPLTQQTRLYCKETNTTKVLRDKENQADYRYLPDPDLLPLHLSQTYLDEIRENLNELPSAILERLTKLDELSHEDSEFLLTSPALLNYYDAVKKTTNASHKSLVNWLKGPYLATLNETNATFEKQLISPEELGELLSALSQKTISSTTAKHVFNQVTQGQRTMADLIQQAIKTQSNQDEAALKEVILQIINHYPEQVSEFRNGKDKLLGFFVGQVMKAIDGAVDPARIGKLIRNQI